MHCFEKVCEFLEQEGDFYTLKELHLKTCELVEFIDVYIVKWFKNKLKEKYGEHIFLPKLKAALLLFVLFSQ